ncbi:MAG: hypothetical protein WCP10_12960 [Desulfuromonadales bacterium]
MPRKASIPGHCAICQAELKKASAAKHIAECLSKVSGKTEYAIVKVEGMGIDGDDYWLQAAVPVDCTLKDLDNFLRRTWLECCGHMSAFRSGRMEIPKSARAGQFDAGEKLTHEYDFGDTTELTITFGQIVTSARLPGREKILVAARNLPHEKKCDCGKQAKYICPICAFDGEGWLCPECADDHECGTPDDVLLPVTNSPRCGVCGYEG